LIGALETPVKITKSDANALLVEQDDGTNVFRVSTSLKVCFTSLLEPLVANEKDIGLSGTKYRDAFFSGEVLANTLKSEVATGTAPLIVASTTVVANLNATQWNGLTNSITSGATGDIYFRDSAGNVVNLGVGSNGQNLQSDGTIPGWVTPAAVTTPSWATVLTAGNTSGGTDVIISTTDELKGTKHSILLSHDAGANITNSAELYLKSGEIIQTATKGLTMIRAGSIVGISINYDITGSGADVDIALDVLVNGSVIFSNTLNDSVADDKEAQFTQARQTDTFAFR